ncbi:MAG: hypothetical protein IJT36_02915 [Alphaproteobacteria bacterium]|nr:hypothetical protein [Alphaproteobacteria bacterium]
MLSKIIDIKGTLYSGASAVCAFLKGADEIFCFGGFIECSFLRDEYSLLVLLNDNVDINSIENFIHNIERYAIEFSNFCNAYYNYTLTESDKNKYKYLFILKCIAFLEDLYSFLSYLFTTWIYCNICIDFFYKKKFKKWNNIILKILSFYKKRQPKEEIVKDLNRRIYLTKKVLSDVLSVVTDKKRVAFLGDIKPVLWKSLDIKRHIFVTRDPRDSYCSYIKRAQDYIRVGE